MVNLMGIMYEVDTMNELTTMPTYIPPNSKAYYFCKENKNLYERTFNGSYIITKDFDHIIKKNEQTSDITVKKEEPKKEEVKDISFSSDSSEFEKVANYLGQHIMSLRYKIDSVIKMLNPAMLPEDINTKYNPDLTIGKEEKNVEQLNENV